MSHLRSRLSAVILAATAVTAGVGATHAQTPSGAPPPSDIQELVTFVPPSAASVGFTDWGRIKASQHAQGLTGASPMDDKLQLVMTTNKDEALASGFGIAHLRRHYDAWAFDALDLDWEATIQGDGPPLFVLRFRDGFDLAPVAALFDDRGFTTTDIPGGTLRSHEMTLGNDWLSATEFGILNTAFLDDGRTLVLSADPDNVREVAANHGSFPVIPSLSDTAAVLDGASAALLLPGLGTCLGFTPLPIDVGDPLASPDLSVPTVGLHPYPVLGIGYGRPDWSPVGRITFGYDDAATAEADLAGRLALATTGISQRVGSPYREVLFQVEQAHVDGANVTLDVTPNGGLPRRLFDMAFARDMTFAGC